MRRYVVWILLAIMLTSSNTGVPAENGSDQIPGSESPINAQNASEIRLEKIEGMATLLSDSGNTLSVIEKMLLLRGYTVGTKQESFAYLSLDMFKALKLDSESTVNIVQTGADLDVLLEKGNLFFNVTEPLREEETLTLRTSTMTIGIRGTSGVICCDKNRFPVMYVLDGEVVVTVSGQETIIPAGYKAELKEKMIVSTLTEEEIDRFVVDEIRKDTVLQEKIRRDSTLDVEWIIRSSEDEISVPETVALVFEDIKTALRSKDAQAAVQLAYRQEVVAFLVSNSGLYVENKERFEIQSDGKLNIVFRDITKTANDLWDNGILYSISPLNFGDEPTGFAFEVCQIQRGDFTGTYERTFYFSDWSVHSERVGSELRGVFSGTEFIYNQDAIFKIEYHDGKPDNGDNPDYMNQTQMENINE